MRVAPKSNNRKHFAQPTGEKITREARQTPNQTRTNWFEIE